MELLWPRVAYGLLTIGGIVIAAYFWRRIRASHPVPPLVFVGGLMGAFVGAKLGYLLCEWPFRVGRPDFWFNLWTGRTILGGLLGGYLGVEWGKQLTRYRPPTGDAFAIAVPLGLAVGRVGCWINGCCPGRVCGTAWYSVQGADGASRYPVAGVEVMFHVALAVTVWGATRRGVWRNQLFHIYLMAYALFRIAHEYLRDTPHIGPISTYQLLAAALFVFAAWRFARRRRDSITAATRGG